MDRHAGDTTAAEESDCTVLFVDGGFPIDVVFYASVWERRKKERRESRVSKQTGTVSILLGFFCQHLSVTQI